MEAFFNHKAIHFQNSFKQNIEKYQNIVVDGKFLIIIACHLDAELKLSAIKNKYLSLKKQNADFIIVYSKNQPFNSRLALLEGEFENTTFLEIENDKYYDFGKWVHALQNVVNINEYDYIVLTNDSFIIHSSINHFFNLTAIHDVELYGYNDSTQTRYHYQSYLFSLRKDAVKIFIDNVMHKNVTITSQCDVINNFEVKMTDWFVSKKCFLTIGNFKLHKDKNIFFTNDKLYAPLKYYNLLPFTKLKRILQYQDQVTFKRSALKLKDDNKNESKFAMVINSKSKTNKFY